MRYPYYYWAQNVIRTQNEIAWVGRSPAACATAIAVAIVSVCASQIVHAGDGIDTRVTFTVADDNILKGPGNSSGRYASPSIPNTTPSNLNNLPGDTHERRDSGFENLTHLVLYAKEPSFFSGVTTEAALVVRAELLNEKGTAITEDGSYLQLTKELGAGNLVITAFPVSADRFRLGYSYDLSWGGSRIFKNTRAAPGMRLQYATETFYGFVGAKTALAQVELSDGTTEKDTVWGVLAGAGVDVTDSLRVEAGGGFFNRGTIDKPELRRLTKRGRFKTAAWQGYGGSAQVVFHRGLPIGTPIDFRLYKNDPLQRQTFFAQENYNDGVSYQLSAEFSLLGQTVQSAEVPNTTVNQPASAADVSAMVKVGKLRAHALGVYRSLAFILFNVPSSPSFVDFPAGIAAAPELLGRVGVDFYIENWHLTPGLLVGAIRPAHTFSVVSAGGAAGAETAKAVFRSDSDPDILDPSDSVGINYFAKLTAKWDLSRLISAVFELQFSHDPNRRRQAKDLTGIAQRIADDPKVLGFVAMLRARF